jgi:collagenase-like PrtC family protease
VRTFTFVTPYVGNLMLARIEESLEYLNSLNIKNPIEVVVNDFGVLRLINTKYKNLKVVFGRVIHKLLKTPLIDTY